MRNNQERLIQRVEGSIAQEKKGHSTSSTSSKSYGQGAYRAKLLQKKAARQVKGTKGKGKEMQDPDSDSDSADSSSSEEEEQESVSSSSDSESESADNGGCGNYGSAAITSEERKRSRSDSRKNTEAELFADSEEEGGGGEEGEEEEEEDAKWYGKFPPKKRAKRIPLQFKPLPPVEDGPISFSTSTSAPIPINIERGRGSSASIAESMDITKGSSVSIDITKGSSSNMAVDADENSKVADFLDDADEISEVAETLASISSSRWQEEGSKKGTKGTQLKQKGRNVEANQAEDDPLDDIIDIVGIAHPPTAPTPKRRTRSNTVPGTIQVPFTTKEDASKLFNERLARKEVLDRQVTSHGHLVECLVAIGKGYLKYRRSANPDPLSKRTHQCGISHCKEEHEDGTGCCRTFLCEDHKRSHKNATTPDGSISKFCYQ